MRDKNVKKKKKKKKHPHLLQAHTQHDNIAFVCFVLFVNIEYAKYLKFTYSPSYFIYLFVYSPFYFYDICWSEIFSLFSIYLFIYLLTL